jgi:hypothetical protein
MYRSQNADDWIIPNNKYNSLIIYDDPPLSAKILERDVQQYLMWLINKSQADIINKQIEHSKHVICFQYD